MLPLVAFLTALALSYGGTVALLRRRPVRAFVDVPGERSSHAAPKPRHGGIAIVGAFLVTFALMCVVHPPVRSFLPLVTGALLLFAAGIVDDWRGLGIVPRLLIQLAAAGIAIASGCVLESVTLPLGREVAFGWFAWPLTALVFLASINFYNFVDGIDGLAAGGAFFAGVFFALIAGMLGQPVLAIVAMGAAGAALGFLQFNFPPSRLFMGDAGSTFFGWCFAYLAVSGNAASPSVPFVVPMLLLASLYVDAGLTILRRLARGEKVFQAHRTHYYQRLLQLGLNHKQVTLLEYLAMILLGASAVIYVRAGSLFPIFVGAAWVVAFVLAILKIRALERGGRMLWERRALYVVASDLVAIVVAYLGAYFLRMNFTFTEAEGQAVLRALPIVVIVRSACFFKYGLYRSMWRYTSTADVIRVIKAVTAGSGIILAAVVLLYRFVAFPRTLFLIEFVLLILLVLGSRFSARLFHEIGRESNPEAARRYAVIGAGDSGERLAREINAQGAGRRVVCFVDDNPARIGLLLHGLPIEGPGEKLDAVCRRHRVDALVYACHDAGEDTAARWVEHARRAGISIEAAGDAAREEPRALVLERASRRHGGRGGETSQRVAGAIPGRRVLVTHAGGVCGASLGSMLHALGATVTMHEDVPTGSATGPETGRAYGPLSAVAEELVAAVAPDVVIHAVSAHGASSVNEDAFAWHHLVRETDALARAVWRRSGCRLVVVSVWGGARPGDRGVATAAVMEAVLLNRSGAEATAVVRVPRVVTAEDVAAGVVPGPGQLLENEVAALVLEIAAGAFRGIYVPASGGVATRGNAGTPLFPAEHMDECGVPGARRVLSPLFPAADPFRRVAASARLEAGRAERDEWLRAVASQLYRLPSHTDSFTPKGTT